ncbi:MAG TPA: hypothetical protein VEA69_21205 [Tepidisphaeraceae bacterium]|nr:hypothetical protein [Tepidisphaeraceae bacterium]
MARYAIDEALRTKVLSIDGVSDLIEGRLYADDAAPQNPTFPYGVITLIGPADRSRKLAGVNKDVSARYQLDFWGLVKAKVREVAELVAARSADGGLDGLQETIGSGATAAYVQSCRIENVRHGSEPPQSAGEARVFNAGFDAVIVFNE